MADNIKISELVELTSGSLSDTTIVPVLDGGTTKKASLSSLQSYLTDDLATDSELATQIGSVNSTISGLDTDDIAEGSNEYFTNARVDARLSTAGVFTNSSDVDLTSTTNYISGIKTRLNTENVISSSQQISASAASSGFGAGGGGGASIPNGTVSSSAQTIENLGSSTILSGSITSTDISDFTTAVSSSAAGAGFGAGGGGEGSTDYISNITLSNSTLTFTGVGSAFNNSINLAADGSDGGNLLTTGDAGNFVASSDYELDSASFASGLGGGGGSVPTGTISSSAQILGSLSGSNIVSSSQQIDGSQIDLSSLTTDDVSEGSVNRYYNNTLVLPYLNQLQVLSGSAGGGGFSVSGTNIVSTSIQIENLGFVDSQTYGTGTASLQSQIDTLDTQLDASVLTDSINTFTEAQNFEAGISITGSIKLSGGQFSGSGAELSNIPSTAIIGAVALSGSTIEAGDVSVVTDNASGITMTSATSGVNITGNVFIASGSFISGSGAGLSGIPGSAIDGGVDGQKINSGSFSASIEDGTGNFVVGPPAIFQSTISASGEITAESISVGSSGTPTIYSSNNLNLSSSGTVVVTDSPLRLNPLTDSQTGSLTIQSGDMIFNNDNNDFFGYRIVNETGSWYSLTEGSVTELEWGTLIGVPDGLISSSTQIVASGSTLLSSSAQFLPSGAAAGTIYFEDTLNNMSGSSDFTYTGADVRTLNVNKIIANEIVYNTSLSGAGNDTGSYGRVETDALNINGAIEFPVSDGTPNQILKTDGNGNLDFGAFADVLGNDNITTNGTISMGTGSVNTNLNVGGTFSIGNPAYTTFNNLSTTIDSANITILSSGSMLLSSSMNVTIDDVLVLPEREVLPENPPSGSLIVSSSGGASIKPWFWDGLQWTALY